MINIKEFLTLQKAEEIKNKWIEDGIWDEKKENALYMIDARDLIGSDVEFGQFDNGFGWCQGSNRETLGLRETNDGKWVFSWLSYDQRGDIADFFRFYYFSTIEEVKDEDGKKRMKLKYSISEGTAFTYFIVFANLWEDEGCFDYTSDSFYKDEEGHENIKREKTTTKKYKTLEEALANVGITNDMKSTYYYLCNIRNIDKKLVDKLVKSRHIRATEKHITIKRKNQFDTFTEEIITVKNTFFRFLNEKGEVVGGSESGNYKSFNKRLGKSMHHKYLIEHSTFDVGFNFIEGDKDNIELVIFTEGAEDLLSFYCLYSERFKKYKGIHFVSMMGKREQTIEYYVKKYGTSTLYILAPDNADDAFVFIDKIKKKFNFIKSFTPKVVKDWSDQLVLKKQKGEW